MKENVLDRLKRQNDAPPVYVCDEWVRLYDDFTIRVAMDHIESLRAEVERLRELLVIAACPACDGRGLIRRKNGRGAWYSEQCQFCYERELFLPTAEQESAR